MQTITSANPTAIIEPVFVSTPVSASDNNDSGMSWSPVLAGAAAIAVLSLLLFILGFGLGLSSLSPWRNEGIEASTLGWISIGWVAFTQIAAAAFGGYLTGRLRVKWPQLHGDEVYFRDTAHGFMAWALATLVTVAVLSSATAAIAVGGVKTGTAIATASAAAVPSAAQLLTNTSENGSSESNAIDYYVDNLFHTTLAPTDPGAQPFVQPALDASSRAEVVRIFSYSLARGDLSAEDKTYLRQLLARRTGMTAANAETRVSAVYNQARISIEQAKTKIQQAADEARKAAAYTALWMFIALLCGAFVASVAAIWGGRQRDCVLAIDV